MSGRKCPSTTPPPSFYRSFEVAIFIISPIGPCIYKKEPLVATNEPKHYITDHILAMYLGLKHTIVCNI